DGLRVGVGHHQDAVLGPNLGQLRQAAVSHAVELRLHGLAPVPARSATEAAGAGSVAPAAAAANSLLTAVMSCGSSRRSAPVNARQRAARTIARRPAGLAAASANSRVCAETPSGTIAMYGWMAGTA